MYWTQIYSILWCEQALKIGRNKYKKIYHWIELKKIFQNVINDNFVIIKWKVVSNIPTSLLPKKAFLEWNRMRSTRFVYSVKKKLTSKHESTLRRPIQTEDRIELVYFTYACCGNKWFKLIQSLPNFYIPLSGCFLISICLFFLYIFLIVWKRTAF